MRILYLLILIILFFPLCSASIPDDTRIINSVETQTDNQNSTLMYSEFVEDTYLIYSYVPDS